MGVYRFEDLDVWKLAKEYCDEIGSAIRRTPFDIEPRLRRGLLTQDEFDRLHAKNLSIARMLRRLYQSLTHPRT